MDDFGPSDPAAALEAQLASGERGPAAAQSSNRNLLRIKVPVTVALASKKQSVGRILDMAPGSILRFDKSCHDSLDLEIGTRRIAQGECVQLGDRLALRVSSLILSTERLEG